MKLNRKILLLTSESKHAKIRRAKGAKNGLLTTLLEFLIFFFEFKSSNTKSTVMSIIKMFMKVSLANLNEYLKTRFRSK